MPGGLRYRCSVAGQAQPSTATRATKMSVQATKSCADPARDADNATSVVEAVSRDVLGDIARGDGQ